MGESKKALQQAKELLGSLSKEDRDRRPRVLLDLYSLIGNAYSDIQKPDMAIMYLQKALSIALRYGYKESYLNT